MAAVATAPVLSVGRVVRGHRRKASLAVMGQAKGRQEGDNNTHTAVIIRVSQACAHRLHAEQERGRWLRLNRWRRLLRLPQARLRLRAIEG